METRSGRVIAKEFDEIPSQKEAVKKISGLALRKISRERLEKERRILYTLDVLSKKECDNLFYNLQKVTSNKFKNLLENNICD